MGTPSHLASSAGPGRARSLPPCSSHLAKDDGPLEAFKRQERYVHRALRRLGVPLSEADDLAQEVFLVLHRGWSDYDAERPLRPYLLGIAFRIAAAHRRKRTRDVLSGSVELDDPSPGPHEILETKEARVLVLEALERVPTMRRKVLIMHHLDDVPVDDVAAVLGLRRFTVYSRLRKGRRELETALRRLTMQEKNKVHAARCTAP